MVLLYSHRPDTLHAPVFRSAPLQFAGEEWVLPHRIQVLEPRTTTEVSERDAETILERFGRTGVVAVKAEGLEEAERRAKRMRHEFLVTQIHNYRTFVSQQQAAGAPITYPRPELYRMQEEYQALEAELLATDPVLSAVLPKVSPKPMKDLLGEELAKLGVQVQPVPAAPALDVGL